MSQILSSPNYDVCRQWIEKACENGLSWENISDHGSANWLKDQVHEQFWPKMSVVEWQELVKEKKLVTERALEIDKVALISTEDTVLGQENDADIRVSTRPGSNWILYRELLEYRGWKQGSIDSIEKKSVETLRRMKRESIEPVKGLVIGHVQSGKTANMAGLMAIGADNGYNIFIILSGTIENLRQQTQKRLFSDLNHPDKLHNCVWRSLEHLRLGSKMEDRSQSLDFRPNSQVRHMTVCLKNASRLKGLIDWLECNPDKLSQMKIVIMDDEADQASINTADVNGKDRSKINKLIVKLTEISAKSVNYISYTATPYANFLNEAWPKSLYPKDFMVALPQPDEHFGPVQIFGLEGREEYDGLDIVREVTPEDVRIVGSIHAGKFDGIPQALDSALSWFLCACATRRLWNVVSPSSMLIHTSQKIAAHENMAKAVREWLNLPAEQLIALCKKVWQDETARLSLDSFRHQFLHYGRLEEVSDYPDFESIVPGIRSLLEQVTNIPIDCNNDPVYHKGIHLCIDNSANNRLNDEMQLSRLIYPSTPLEYGTAFIVIGGNTLSRGLTIEGLLSTFFLRNSVLADSLMQMGRWFGYRKGYELLSRVWMTSICREKYEYMTVVEQELREELHGYMAPPYINPSQVAPRIRNSPSLNWLRVTARNKMQNAEPVGFDFSGTNAQTTMFFTDRSILEKNVRFADEFLKGLGVGEKSGDSLLWKSVGFEAVQSFLGRFGFHPRARLFGQIEAFLQWFSESREEVGYKDWNVVVGGIQDSGLGSWEIGQYSVNKIKRTRLARKTSDGSIAIGVLRAPQDLLADVPESSLLKNEKLDNLTVVRKRLEAGLGKTPQLLLYRISKDSKADETAAKRADLDVPVDLIGVSLWIPGVRDVHGNPNHVRMISVRLPGIAIDDEVDIH